MIQAMKNRRTSLAVLAAGALVASLLAVGAAPVGAFTDWADNTTELSACVGEASEDQEFADVSERHVFRDAINCIAYYGITLGTGDGSRFSPNRPVTRAQMAVFMARAAEIAGVDLGEADDAGFSDIEGVWQEAQDAINRLANKEMIPKGRKFRPDDAVTRGEMATFLIGLLVAAAPNVTKHPTGDILLRSGAKIAVADDYFPDARDTLPRPIDAEVSALYELGVTKGASPAAVRDPANPPLDFNYQPAGVVNRGQMAVFITRALAHTSVRPGGNLRPVRRQLCGRLGPRRRLPAEAQRRGGCVPHRHQGLVDVAFRTDGSCDEFEVNSMGGGTYVCEIDGADPITGGDGDTSMPLSGVDEGGTTVWAWTGETEATAKNDDAGLYQLDIPEDAVRPQADRVRVSTEFTGAKAHLGSSVIYTVQLQDAKGDVRFGINCRRQARFLVTLSTYPIISDGTNLVRSPQGASAVRTLPLTTDSRGRATFSVSGLDDPDPSLEQDKYAVDIKIQPRPNGNAPPVTAFYIDDEIGAATPIDGLVTVRAAADNNNYSAALVFSTEPSSHAAATVSVKSASDYVIADARGASNRAIVTVADQYGDPIPGAEVSLATEDAGDHTIASGRALAVGRDGSYTFGYERIGPDPAAERLTASWNHDGDDGTTDTIDGTAIVEWAADAEATGTDVAIVEFDKETDTIFLDTDTDADGGVVVLYYDENDRFDVGASGSESPSTYAGFERALDEGLDLALDWEIAGTGRRAVNKFTLTASPVTTNCP